ncbi:HAMP domain-containing sensor histidine kinase [Paraclostridium ghonii]|uniref:HAMP domain-containing sensor histidine kinase n=1 Tax=Paraclostridium ghonii TaxID=29358 RepID=UPI00202CBD65|nr:HAMP domain-containing histidine kinase [Paeniclostridium ghonii]
MNNYIKSTFKKYLILLLALIILFAISITLSVKEDYFKDIDNTCRVLVHDQLNAISNNLENQTYKYTIVSLDGYVIKSTEDNSPNKISVSNLSIDNWQDINNKGVVRYSTPLIIDGKIDKIAIFSIPKIDIINFRNDINDKNIYKFSAIIILLLIVFIIFKIYKLINKDILEPINKMHKSASEILKGNYLEKVEYDYYGEVGKFSHDFERMRESLIISREREKKLKIAEKELLACISHDLKTPIANISGYCEGIIDGIVKEERDIKRYAGIILKKAKVLTKLLDDILELSKAEINQMSINKKEVYSKEFFDELLEEISMDVISSGRQFVVENEPYNLLINIDKDKITQAINNIISNSIKYTSSDGIISIRFEKITDGMEIRVKDNGIGISADDVDLVFNKFYRSEKHRNQNIPGSGLGLSIAKYITEMHNGSIEMISGNGSGTTVIVKIRNIK